MQTCKYQNSFLDAGFIFMSVQSDNLCLTCLLQLQNVEFDMVLICLIKQYHRCCCDPHQPDKRKVFTGTTEVTDRTFKWWPFVLFKMTTIAHLHHSCISPTLPIYKNLLRLHVASRWSHASCNGHSCPLMPQIDLWKDFLFFLLACWKVQCLCPSAANAVKKNFAVLPAVPFHYVIT